MSKPIDYLIDSSVACGVCGTRGIGNCDCYEKCSCGWFAEAGKPCRNPETVRCTTKIKYTTEPSTVRTMLRHPVGR